MITRRTFLGLAAALPASRLALPRPVEASTGAGLVAPAAPLKRHFDVYIGTQHVGQHTIEMLPEGAPGDFRVHTVISVHAQPESTHAYRFEHESDEVWKGGWLETVTGKTNDDGKELAIEGQRTARGIELTTPEGPFVTDAKTLTSNSIWSERTMAATQIISVQFAAVVGMVAIDNGQTTVSVNDQTLLAKRYEAVSPFTTASLWYDSNGLWIAAKVEKNGELLDYRLHD
jgi:hypothetical protein